MGPIKFTYDKYNIHNNISYGNIIFKGARIFIELPPFEANFLVFFYKKVLEDDWILLYLLMINILYIIIYHIVI